MILLFRFLIPATIALYSLFLMPGISFGFHHVNQTDLPGVYLSLAMVPLLLPAALLTLITPRWGSLALATVGGLGILGVLLTPSFFSSPFYVGLGPAMFLLALADGSALHWFKTRKVMPI
ncbi:hypothetical protein HDF12_000781 [Edaphobacter lichenicola]|uniref:Uncharacterized protein n=1 Tax=Tunturiibacter lichenicola TaxID=2051959 RepID=A0A7Y9NJB1_9BACT|nr:hypothetical protein [Edaphobacter lichenicola]